MIDQQEKSGWLLVKTEKGRIKGTYPSNCLTLPSAFAISDQRGGQNG